MRKLQNLIFSLLGLGTGLLILGLTLLPGGMASASAASSNVSHAYHSNSTITNGSVVSLDPKQAGYVVPANTDNGTSVVGVSVDSNDSLVAVDAGSGGVQVATSGTASVFVSNLSGDIAAGDQVAVSPFDGIGMKATADSQIIGVALTALNSKTTGTTRQTVKDSSGTSKTVTVGSIRISISPGSASKGGSSDKINGLQKMVQSLTGKVIPTARIVVALCITVVTLIVMIALIYGSVYSTIISVGRNPLAKYAIFRSLAVVMALTLAMALVAIVVIGLLLH
jgi:hypothetical protein